ncbi:hypothetical protein EUX98_g7098 [Antrodiella citrinella]|uniref:Uncharacterized protein n=1 Tax=Antrodiella citrinella TaxID=2447956 RepID=A0A4S4MN79_9APHY|nr:hypothetical protein EUX98_g7098 [Antrodiella citrinella]
MTVRPPPNAWVPVLTEAQRAAMLHDQKLLAIEMGFAPRSRRPTFEEMTAAFRNINGTYPFAQVGNAPRAAPPLKRTYAFCIHP